MCMHALRPPCTHPPLDVVLAEVKLLVIIVLGVLLQPEACVCIHPHIRPHMIRSRATIVAAIGATIIARGWRGAIGQCFVRC